ncbi:MAG TPA: amino acid ABC transporter permease [Anaerolineaceae bacterium]|jgi:polar amino acid transport system permease protein|nr:amino acid ABC transporter permease [Anaerolineaceae bacterium]HOE34145.1 amino acid ABC transporter permease [Anaerolineaceae bacterium]HOT25142.1 amino acid ABC transporter permease [Anaerolineaceae bacterium]HQH57926.1 amino acid ABC transporter permease [Anaerolineaceae bacterium]HQK02797.1 amino acid ABC transporter permease [Anaerolineaceae bacterium]
MEWLQLLQRFFSDFMRGAAVTLELTAVGLTLGFVLGLLLALAKVYAPRWLSNIATAYIELFRGTPLLVQLFLIYYGLPSLGITLSQTLSAYLALGLNSAAYQAEYLRGAIQAIGPSQMMAGRSIGLSRWQTIRFIILPQALRLALPSWSNEPISLLKTTAVVFLIAVQDLMAKAKRTATITYNPIGSYLAVAAVYLVMVFALNALLKWMERKTKIPGFDIDVKRV